MRESGELPWEWVIDGTRWVYKPESWPSVEIAALKGVEDYRYDLWLDRAEHVEIWIEKQALANVLYPITSAYNVGLAPAKGFSSLTFLHDAAERLAETGKPAYVYYFGDWDTSGRHIGRNVERKLRLYAPDAEIHFERVAINEDQIREYRLPTRPDKKDKKPAVELDALPPDVLESLVREVIERHVEPWELEAAQEKEDAEREQWKHEHLEVGDE